METKKRGFLLAMRSYFCLKEGQSSLQFAAEVKALTPADRMEMWEGLQAAGVACEKPAS